MVITFIETPFTKDRDMSVEFAHCPKDAEIRVAVFDEHSDDNTAFYEALADTDVVLMYGYVYLDREKIDAMPKCKVISFESTGFNEVDFDYATQKGITIVSIEDYCTQETAENAFTMMLCLQRATLLYNRSVQQDKEWSVAAVLHLQRVEGQTMGIVGLGRIGRSVATKAHGFGMRVIAYDPYLPPEIAESVGVKLVAFDTLLEEADVISIHMNLTEENVHMFNKETFRKMKKKPILINEGRGPMICEADLAWALDEGLVRAAGLDMLESEVPDRAYLERCPLLGRDNVILNPHSGYTSDTSEYLVGKLSVENALLCYAGRQKEAATVRNGIGM